LLERKGAGFTPADVAHFWLSYIPLLNTCTAERIAYRNLANGLGPPASAGFRNPYREWIGAQIRADFFGYAAAGDPPLAAELAWRDASISHVKNGIYGEMWAAAMIAAALVTDDLPTIIEAGLGQVPRTSRLHEAVRDVLAWHAGGLGYDDAVARLHQRWDEKNGHHWCHTISNAQVVAIGLLWGEGDYGRSICRAVQPCFDTDCNGATVGSILGAIHGSAALPQKWTGMIHNKLRTAVRENELLDLTNAAKRTLMIADMLRS